MFSRELENQVKESVSLEQFDDIKDICAELKAEAYDMDLFEQSIDGIKQEANHFIDSFALKHGMNTRTIRPHAWSFSIGDKQQFEDGVIELYFDNNQIAFFTYVDVSRSKITDNHRLV